jgi:hypothetical protein
MPPCVTTEPRPAEPAEPANAGRGQCREAKPTDAGAGV